MKIKYVQRKSSSRRQPFEYSSGDSQVDLRADQPMEATEPLFGGDMSADELIDSYPTDTFHRDYVISPPTPPLQPPTPPAKRSRPLPHAHAASQLATV